MAVYQATALQRFMGQEVRNVLYYDGPELSLGGGDVQLFADAFRASWVGAIPVSNMGNDWRLYGVNLRRVDATGTPSIDVGFTLGDAVGTNSGEELPTQIALLVHGVAYTNKPNRVRSYLAGWVEGHNVSSQWGSGARALALAWGLGMDALSVGAEEYGRVAAQWSPALDTVVLWNRLEAYFTSGIPATQRRRRIGRGI